jgi:hypothetical protein
VARRANHGLRHQQIDHRLDIGLSIRSKRILSDDGIFS